MKLNVLLLLFTSYWAGDCARIPDPSCASDNKGSTDDEIVSEGYYKHITGESVYILAQEVVLDGETMLNFDPCKDFRLNAVNVVVKGTVKWKAKSVSINAVNLTVVGEAAIIDASYQSVGLPDYHEQAPSGASVGASGSNGKAGGIGGDGGSIALTVSRLFGGKLVLRADGGPGGSGQEGGDGHIGADGAPNSDRDACCHGRLTRGGTGGKGGDGGAAGKSGDGGKGGDLTLHIPFWADKGYIMSRVSTSVVGGKPGAEAKPGKGEEGGYGGAGSATGCYNAGHWYDHHMRCHGGLGPNGPQGQPGNPGSAASPAAAGSVGAVRIQVGGVSQETPLTMIQMAVRDADSQYKEGKFGTARDIYMWIMDVTRNRTDKESLSYRRLSATCLSQMSHGLDFWGHLPNNMPLNSYESIFSHLEKDVIPYAKDVETDYDDFFSKATAQEKRLTIVRSSLQHARYLIGLYRKQEADARDNLAHVTEEIRELEVVQAQVQYRSESATQLCKDAIEHYMVHKETAISFHEVFQLIRAGIEIFESIYTGFGTLKAGVFDVIGALEAAKGINGSFWEDLKKIGTIVKNVTYQFDKAKDALVTDVDSVKKQFDQIKDITSKAQHENDAKMLVDGQKFNKMVGQWLFLSECVNAKAAFTAYLNTTRAVNDKIMQHDSIVIQIAKLESQVSKYQGLQARLQGQMVGNYDPFTITYALAIGEVYVNLKDAIVNELKKLQEAYNYQFLEGRPFTYDDSRIAMMEAWMANNRIEMLDRMSQLGTEVQEFNKNLKPMTNTIVLKRELLPDDFRQLDQNHTMPFAISGAEKELAPLTHVHMTDVKVWLPGIKSSSSRVKVWLKRYGSSVVYDQRGEMWTFTHGARTMLFDYRKDNLEVNAAVSIPQVFFDSNSGLSSQNEYVALSPIGPWVLGIPAAYNTDVNTSEVNEIHVQLSGTFLPCANMECPPREAKLFSEVVEEAALSPEKASRSVGKGTTYGIIFGSIGATIVGLVALIVVIHGVRKFRQRRGYDRV
eukprot:m.306893 g.306893  ORF g.306893 m.306893 type:complete len:1015 (+) comp41685_c0_seq1:21-3065(+)